MAFVRAGEMTYPEPRPGEVRGRVTLMGMNPGNTKNAATGWDTGCPSRASFRTAIAPASSAPSGQPQKTLKERRSEKRAAKKLGSGSFLPADK
jgi:hypothetical protein